MYYPQPTMPMPPPMAAPPMAAPPMGAPPMAAPPKSSGGGAIQITINGKYQVTEISIDPETIDPENVDMLEDLITTGFNEAIEKIQQ